MTQGRGTLAGIVGALALALTLAGCGKSAQREAEKPPPAPGDTLAALAEEVERHFLLAVTDTLPNSPQENAARTAIRSLLAGILEHERPSSGWTAPGLESALRERRLTAVVRELDGPGEPWLLLVSDPRRAEGPQFSWFVFGSRRDPIPVEIEPFRSPFQTVVWTDSLARRLLVTGSRRSPAGPQPAAWLLPMPSASAGGEAGTDSIPPLGAWGLSGVGSAEVDVVRPPGGGAPRIAVSRAVLPNPLFDECPACPHLEGDVVYRIAGSSLLVESRRPLASPYASFVHLIEALTAHDDSSASFYAGGPLVLEQARSLELDRAPRAGRWRIAPGTTAMSLDQVYLRGEEGAFRVLSAPGDSGFVVTSISTTTFSLE